MLHRDLEQYIDGKRSLGFKFHSQSGQLRSFVAFAESRGGPQLLPRTPHNRGLRIVSVMQCSA